jgi:tetratricopeptide (TPR) repeat protein
VASCVLARSQLALGNPAKALSVANAALELRTSAGLESEIELLTVRAQALAELGDLAGAQAAFTRARDWIDRIGAQIADVELRRSFVVGVEPCQRAIRLASEWAQGARA